MDNFVFTILLVPFSLFTEIGASITGQLNVISQNESIDIYNLTLAGDVSSVFSAQLELHLRPPCPSSHPSYNLASFNDHILILSTGLLSIFTFVSKVPYVYTQSVLLPDCEPLSIVMSPLLSDVFFLDCKDVTDSGNFFLAELERLSDDTGRHSWTFEQMNGFETIEQAGAFVEVTAVNSDMMLYVHAQGNYIEVNGFLSGYINILPLPDGCGHIVRITVTGKPNLVLLECSNNASDLVTGLFLLELESVIDTHLFDTAPYVACPIRFSSGGDLAAIFTEHYILVIDLVSNVFTNISVNQAIYDGVLTESVNNAFYLVYTTSSGLHRAYLTRETGHGMKVENQLLFSDTSTVCVHQSCPLLTLVDSDSVMVAFNFDIAIFSISGLYKVSPRVHVKFQPSRIVFQERNSSNLLAPIITPKTTTPPPKETATPPKDGYGVKESQKQHSTHNIVVVAVTLPVSVVIIITIVSIVIFAIRRVRRNRHRKLLVGERLTRGTPDKLQLLPDYHYQISDHNVEVQHFAVEGERDQELPAEGADGEELEQPIKRTEKEERVKEEKQQETQNGIEPLQQKCDRVERNKDKYFVQKGKEECSAASTTSSSTNSPVTESLPENSMAVDVTQETSFDARFGARQQQVVGSIKPETQETRASPDGCTSS